MDASDSPPVPDTPVVGVVPVAAPDLAEASTGALADAAAADSGATQPQAFDAAVNRVLLHMPVDIRSASLATIAAVTLVFMLQWASALLVPLMLGLVLSYALAPVVRRVQRLGPSRMVATALVMTGLVGALGSVGYVLRDDATQFVEGLPDMAQKVRRTMQVVRRGPESALDKVQQAAAQLEQAAAEAAAPTARGVTRVEITKARFDFKDYLLTQFPVIATGLAQAVVVLFVAFFLLASGDTFRRKMVKLTGPTLARKKITVQALDEITDQIQRYLLVQVWISLLVGVSTALAYWALGVEHAAVWGVLAFLLNFVPYIGSLAVTAGSGLAAFMQFGSGDMALLVMAVSMALHTVSGYLLMPWLTSRASQMNAVAVFVGVLAFGWIWGIWGLVLGVPILLMVKTVCDRSDNLKPLGELLSS